jgi:hypothetical protein
VTSFGALRHHEELIEFFCGTDVVKYFKFRRLQLASHIVQIDTSRIPKKILDGKFHGRRPVGKS